MQTHVLDKLDRQILNILQTDATVPLKTLAERVNSSVATCQRRVQNLHRQGIIIKEVVMVNPAAVGRNLSVFVLVGMEKQSPALQDAFVRSMDKEADVMSCYEISGDFDYILLVHVRDMADYHHFTRRALTAENNVRSFKSQFVMNFNKVETKISL